MNSALRFTTALPLLLLIVLQAVAQPTGENASAERHYYRGAELHFDITSMHLYKSHELLLNVHSNQEVDSYHLSVVNESGSSVMERDVTGTANTNIHMNTDDLQQGVYELKITIGDETFKTGTLII